MASTTSSRKASTSEDKENYSTLSDSTASVASSAALLLLQAEKAKQEKISVKERTKTFNRMASQVEVAGQQGMSSIFKILLVLPYLKLLAFAVISSCNFVCVFQFKFQAVLKICRLKKF
jgi:cytochrome c-type biogenesis protein CcmH/NrfG